jgi:hypothetical protein
MSVPPSQQSAHFGHPRRDQRNGYVAAARKPSPDEPKPESSGWDERVADEVRHQEVIEATFDRAEAYERLGDFEHALEWLDRASALCNGLPPAYRSRRARWARAAARAPRPSAGGWRDHGGSAARAAPGA